MIEKLHPTPALGGSPQHTAIEFIRETESVPRGWYGAPVGWIDRDLNGQFSVAIRSAISQDKRVWLYAGAGIVADSIAQKEWDENCPQIPTRVRGSRHQGSTQWQRLMPIQCGQRSL